MPPKKKKAAKEGGKGGKAAKESGKKAKKASGAGKAKQGAAKAKPRAASPSLPPAPAMPSTAEELLAQARQAKLAAGHAIDMLADDARAGAPEVEALRARVAQLEALLASVGSPAPAPPEVAVECVFRCCNSRGSNGRTNTATSWCWPTRHMGGGKSTVAKQLNVKRGK